MEKKINRKNFSVDHSGQILTDSRKLAKILPISRKSYYPHWDPLIHAVPTVQAE